MEETQPLLRREDDAATNESCQDPPESRTDLDPRHDPEHPFQWPWTYRWGIVALLAFMAFTVTFTCIGLVPIAGDIVADLKGKRDKSASVLLVTIWELGEAAGPLLIAPLSEVYGRYRVFSLANALFIVGVLVTALSESAVLLIFARFLTGTAVASNVLNPAIIGDIFPPESRGTAMSIVMLAPLLGGAIGPAIAGAIAQSTGWRQVVWMAFILAAVCECAFVTLLRETYGPTILQQKAARPRRQLHGGTKAALATEDVSSESALWRSIMRPASIIAGSVILQILSLYGAVVFSFFYVMSTTLPEILATNYGLSPALVGSSFLSFSVGSFLGIIVCNTCLDRIYNKLRKASDVSPHPEYRLPLVIIGAFCLPAGVVLYGWVAELRWSVVLLLLAVILQGFSLILSVVPIMAYIVDAFGLYSASALTAILISRCLMGTFLPLATAPLTDALGYGWGFTILAAMCLSLAPIPLVVMRYGAEWRKRSQYTKDA